MNAENMITAVTDDAATFASTMFYRSLNDMETDVLRQEGNVALLSNGKMQGKHDIWRAMYEAHTNDGVQVLVVTPNTPAARGTILTITDEMERSPFPSDLWGVERQTQMEIEFDNGSRIKTASMQPSNAPDNIRGYAPDLLIVHDWTEEGQTIDQKTMEHILVPMAEMGDANLWINATEVQDDPLFDWAFQNGVYVHTMDR